MANIKNSSKADLTEELRIAGERFDGSDATVAISGLTFPRYTDSARIIMLESHFNQRVVLNKTEFPRVFTNNENMVGEFSSFVYKAKGNLKVMRIIHKFDQIDNINQPALIFIYNEDDDMYDVINRNEVQHLTEKYGFSYDNTAIDNLRPGDHVPKDKVLSKPTSFDDYGNWGFGRNVKFMYQIKDTIIEDAIEVSESLSKLMESTEVELVKVSINDNDILLNVYGVENNYKTFPDIGEAVINKSLCVRRRINNSQILFDLKSSNTRRVLGTDITSYIEGDIVDVDIYCNKEREEISKSEVNNQLLEYLDMSTRFYTDVKEYTQQLLDSGVKCSSNIKVLNKRAKELTDKSYKIKDENSSVFNNIIIYFLVKRRVGLSIGQKLTGRYGNKGVISRIVPDHLMPVLDNGERVDIIFDTLGVYNRLNIFQLYEQSITFQSNRIRERLAQLPNFKDKEKLLFEFIAIFNEEQSEKFKNAYIKTCKSEEHKEYYFDIIQKEGIFIHILPLWHKKNLYDCIDEVYNTYPWITPYDVYQYEPHTERYIKTMNKQIVGDMYVMKLKQNSKKGLSTRSTGSISKRGVPEKSDSAKKHTDPYSKNPIRFGRQETINQYISINPDTVANQHLLYRSSVKGRRALSAELLKDFGKVKEVKLTPDLTNRNVEILNAYLKVMGYELVFDRDRVDLSPDNKVRNHFYKGYTYTCTSDQMREYIAKDIAHAKIQEGDIIYMGDHEGYEQLVNDTASLLKHDLNKYLV